MNENLLNRREAVARLLEGRQELLVVTGLGSSSYDVMAAGDHDNNFYLWAAMGSAAMVGMGLAMSQPGKSVLVLTGDGEIMMGLGSLATIAVTSPSNLSIGVLDNGHFGETGMQVSHTGHGVRIDQAAVSLGFHWTAEINDFDGLDEFRDRINRHEGPQLATIKISADSPARVLPPRDGVYIKNRFRGALGFQPL